MKSFSPSARILDAWDLFSILEIYKCSTIFILKLLQIIPRPSAWLTLSQAFSMEITLPAFSSELASLSSWRLGLYRFITTQYWLPSGHLARNRAELSKFLISVLHLDVEDFSEELLRCLLCNNEAGLWNAKSPLLALSSLLVLYSIRAPIIGPFHVWKPTNLMP